MLLHVPHSYRDRAEPRQLSELAIGEQATVEVEVRSVRLRRTRRRGLTIVEATVADDSGPAKAVWFNQPWLTDRLREGTRLLLYGKLFLRWLRKDFPAPDKRHGGCGRRNLCQMCRSLF